MTIHGANDAPAAVADAASATEAGGVANGTAGVDPVGNVLTNDTDVDTGDTKTVSAVAFGATPGTVGSALVGAHGALTLNADGSYSYAVAQTDAAVQALRTATDTLTDTFSYTMRDTAGATSTTTLTVTIHGADDAAVAVNDVNSLAENATINGASVVANDYDVDGPLPLRIASVNGSSAAIGTQVTMASGALLTMRADGTYDYNPNHAYDYLTAVTGAANSTGTDSFTYALVNGGSTTVTITISGVASPGDHANGTAGNDTMVGTPGNDYFDLSQGGNDTVSGGAGNDAFFFGAAFTAADRVDGGPGFDQIGLQGDYTGANALVLGANTIVSVETIAVLPGFSYDITTNDGNVAAGQTLNVFGGNLIAGNSFTFNGSAETDGSFKVFGGLGADHFTGGAGNDGFYFGPGRFDQNTDSVDGGGGSNNQLALDGNYTVALSGTAIHNIQVIALLKANDGSLNAFNITTDDALVSAGQNMTIYGAQLTTGFTFDGHNEHDGHFTVFGSKGDDTIIGSDGADRIFGGLGADTLTGGLGANVFEYTSYFESTSTSEDRITDFKQGDIIDLSQIDAILGTSANDPFTFIGNQAFHNVAGELRFDQISATDVRILGDVNGDGIADFSLLVHMTGGHVIAAPDFIM